MQPPTNNSNPKRAITGSNNSNQRGHGTGQSTTSQACAACKYQRRKCEAACILAPYFPHDRQRQFLNAHRLFGVSNIVKIIRHLDPAAQCNAMRTIIFQSDARAADPVGGCLRIIRRLEHRLALARSELDILLHHLALYRAAAIANHRTPFPTDEEPPPADDTNSSWSACMHGGANSCNNNNINNHNIGVDDDPATSSSMFPADEDHEQHHNWVRGRSMEDCEQMRSILDHLSGPDDDGANEDHKHADVLASNDGILAEEMGTLKEADDDGPFSYIGEQAHDLKAPPTFFTLTNYDI